MAISFVQSRSVAGLSLAYTGNVTLGNLLIVVVGDTGQQGQPITFGCSDSQPAGGNVYTPLPVVDGSSQGGASGQLFWAIAKATGANTVTITDSAVTPQLLIHEFSGVNAKDQAHSAIGSGNAQDSGSVTTSISTELLFGFVINNISTGLTFTAGAGWTQAEKIGLVALSEYQIVSTIGTFNATSSTTVGKGGGVSWAAQIATFNGPIVASSGDYWLGGRQHETKIVLPGYAN